MVRRQRKEQEWIPWYRRKDYKGDLTEVEKRELDAFRMQDKHPATEFEDLPQEVQQYIGSLELQVYDFKQDFAVARPILASVVGALFVFLSYRGFGNLGDLGYVFGAILLTVPWFIYRREWRRNADEFIPGFEDAPNPTDEAIRSEWEAIYIAGRRRKSQN